MVDNNIRARGPSGSSFTRNNNSPQELSKNFEKISNKPEMVAQVSKDAAVVVTSSSPAPSKASGDSSGMKGAIKTTREATESVRRLSQSDTGSEDVRIPPVGIEELAKDLESLKENIKTLFVELRSKSETVAVADANVEASQSQTGTLDKLLSKAEDTGLKIRFKPKSALSAHSDRISPNAVEKLLAEDRGNI